MWLHGRLAWRFFLMGMSALCVAAPGCKKSDGLGQMYAQGYVSSHCEPAEPPAVRL